jgi:GrpB-like predicted nucleotidyltransferase (UPF0157 family)
MDVVPNQCTICGYSFGRWDYLCVVDWFGEAGAEPPVLVNPDASWPLQFEGFVDQLHRALRDASVRVCHIGSTALSEMPAKPVIDIQVSVPDVEHEAAYRPQIESLGWPLRARAAQHRFFRPPAGQPRVVHVHVCSRGSAREREVLLFRDYLRANKRRREEYADLKRGLVAVPKLDRQAYLDGKQPFIATTLREAERWAHQNGWSAASAGDA